jgi:hypothetical protein
MLDELSKCDELKMDPNELKNNWLLPKDKNEQTAFYPGSKTCLLEKVWIGVKGVYP